MISKLGLLRLFRKEFATTISTMEAFPPDAMNFSPHSRSRNARQLLSTFVFEMWLIDIHVFGAAADRAAFQSYAPKDLQGLMRDFATASNRVVSLLESLKEDELSKTVEFAGKKMSAEEFMLLMLFDQIHHRGQLSVYIRMAGGKVPSVYGPSADDKRTNIMSSTRKCNTSRTDLVFLEYGTHPVLPSTVSRRERSHSRLSGTRSFLV
jgi:uncharacterized damage-inducible protein DinB